jgi:hypothetical protein
MSDGTLQILDVTMLDDVNNASGLVQLDSNAKIPACSGAALTNLPGVTKNASDPVIATNPSGGVGSVWQNTTSGEMYICTDATAGSNVWTNIGAGTGDIAPFAPHNAVNYGYCAGGIIPASNIIEKWSLSSATANATDVGDLYLGTGSGTSNANAGSSSTTYGYSSGGYKGSGGGSNSWNTIDKWSFSTDGNATDVGDITFARRYCGGTSSSVHGYCVGGYQSPGGNQNIIDKFTFASDGNATDHGDMSTARGGVSAMPSETHGYSTDASATEIQKFAFGSGANAVVYSGVLTATNTQGSSHSSSTHGYASGTSTVLNFATIEKFSYASEGNSTNVGVLTAIRGEGMCGVSSSTHGYCAGGNSTAVDIIDRFAYSSDGNAVDVGNLTVARVGGAGAEY